MIDYKLSAKQERFCKEYMIDLNATQAAIRTGYSARSAYSQGQRLLKHAEIAKALQDMQENAGKLVDMTAEWVLIQLKENHTIARENGDIGHSNKALELIGKHLGMFIDKQEISQAVTVEIITGAHND
jgi:phage terminase small subunit